MEPMGGGAGAIHRLHGVPAAESQSRGENILQVIRCLLPPANQRSSPRSHRCGRRRCAQAAIAGNGRDHRDDPSVRLHYGPQTVRVRAAANLDSITEQPAEKAAPGPYRARAAPLCFHIPHTSNQSSPPTQSWAVRDATSGRQRTRPAKESLRTPGPLVFPTIVQYSDRPPITKAFPKALLRDSGTKRIGHGHSVLHPTIT